MSDTPRACCSSEGLTKLEHIQRSQLLQPSHKQGQGKARSSTASCNAFAEHSYCMQPGSAPLLAHSPGTLGVARSYGPSYDAHIIAVVRWHTIRVKLLIGHANAGDS